MGCRFVVSRWLKISLSPRLALNMSRDIWPGAFTSADSGGHMTLLA